ncbi:hypothetical protein Lal_00001857 [Lupinus albus]|nr:hypothetical protein Lal_00001857 [Lupinus albus]
MSEETNKTGSPFQNGSIVNNIPPFTAEPLRSIATHVILRNVGECISTAIMNLSRDLGRNICVVAANREFSRVRLRLATNEYVTYEGRFMIQSLSGSLLLFDGNGPSGRSGGLNRAGLFYPGDGVVDSLLAPRGSTTKRLKESDLVVTQPVVLLSFPGEFCNASKKAKEKGNSSAPPN